jgi:hypothetical protein
MMQFEPAGELRVRNSLVKNLGFAVPHAGLAGFLATVAFHKVTVS